MAARERAGRRILSDSSREPAAIPPGTEAQPITVPVGSGRVSGLWIEPHAADRLFVLAHGAGAGMRHAFMESMARELAGRGIATLRFQFPYVEAGRRRPDPPGRLQAALAAAVETGRRRMAGAVPFAGGKSMGGRMASLAAAAGRLPGLAGLIFLGFPLHPAGRPGTERAAHLSDVPYPMLFLQGTRDRLADLDLLRPALARLGERARLEVIEGADHGFAVLKRSGTTAAEVRARLADTIDGWTRERATGRRAAREDER